MEITKEGEMTIEGSFDNYVRAVGERGRLEARLEIEKLFGIDATYDESLLEKARRTEERMKNSIFTTYGCIIKSLREQNLEQSKDDDGIMEE